MQTVNVELVKQEAIITVNPVSPQKHSDQLIIKTPCRVPEEMLIAPSPNMCEVQISRPLKIISPSMSKARTPFTPFCRENLSPLCSAGENYSLSNVKRFLFSGSYDFF